MIQITDADPRAQLTQDQVDDLLYNEVTQSYAPFTLRNALRVKRLTPNATLPTRGTPDAIGTDLYADLIGDYSEAIPMRIEPGKRRAIPTSIAVQFPSCFYARVAPRSGLALKNGLDVLAGVIDRDYTGEIVVILQNNSRDMFTVTHGMRVAQLILERADILPIVEVDSLSDTARGSAGFGSTGA